MSDASRAVWPRYRKSGMFAAGVIVIGIILGFIWGQSHGASATQFAFWVQLLGTYLVLGSILAQLGWEKPSERPNETWTKDTDVERLDRRLFRVLNMSGICLFTVGASAATFAAAA